MTTSDPLWGLPDPDTHGEFYAATTMKRFFAWIVDTVLILLLSLVAIPFTAFVGLFFFALLFLMVSLVYRIAAIAAWSATPGMLLAGLELRTARGERFDAATAAAHTILYLVMMSFFVLQAVSILLMLTSARGQGLHDHLLGTAAINRARTW
ncbi:MAG: RDD family protein [Rhodobacteraceae bacterium]|nr:RDD family protein [Paracoccaceae bacterium]